MSQNIALQLCDEFCAILNVPIAGQTTFDSGKFGEWFSAKRGTVTAVVTRQHVDAHQSYRQAELHVEGAGDASIPIPLTGFSQANIRATAQQIVDAWKDNRA